MPPIETAHRDKIEISVVVPLFNEAENIDELYRRLSLSLRAITERYELLFVDDGSTDDTTSILMAISKSDPHIAILSLSRNFGHQAAITAGIDFALGQAVILMDGDLQDPPEVLYRFVDAWRAGSEVAYAVRTKRKEHIWKRSAYYLFYRLLKSVSDLDIPLDSGDFCLMDRKVVDILKSLPERTRFVRGLRTFVGFRQVGIVYERAERAAGKPKYTFAALLRLAIEGLVSFSSRPLQLATFFGFTSAFFGFALTIWVFWDAFSQGMAPRGWASTLAVVLVMGSVQLLCLGIIGQYLQRTFLEAKQRPVYLARSIHRTCCE